MSDRPIQDMYPLSPMQQGMLFHSLFEEGSEAYFEQVSTTLHGELDTAAFARAWQQVVERHTVLRTGFFWKKRDEPYQVVFARAELPWEEQDWSGVPEAEQRERLAAFLASDRARGFDLAQPPLMRIAVFRLGERSWQFVWSHHHLLLDGWARPQVLQEALAIYDAIRQGTALRLPAPRPYRDYIAWLLRQDRGRAEAFWRRTLGDFAGPTPFGVDRPLDGEGPERNGGDRRSLHETRETALPAGLLAALQGLGREHKVTLATLVQSVWGLLLSRYSGEEDVVFGTVVSGRPPDLPGVESMVGLFINTLPVRVRSPRDLTCLGWLQRQMALQAELRHYEHSPLVDVRKWSLTPAGRQLFESIVVFQNLRAAAGPAPIEADLRVAGMQVSESADFPLVLIAEPEGELVLRIEYDRRRFDAVTVERMLGNLGALLRHLPRSLDRRLGELPMLSEAERHQLLCEWNATARPWPAERPIHALFADRAAGTPEATAVVFRGGRLSYRELDRQANRLAHRLRALGVGPEVTVGLCVERSMEVAVGILGILKAGGAYVPLDPAYPAERIAYMLADARVPVLVTQERLAAGLPTAGVATVLLDGIDAGSASGADPAVRVEPDNLAYVIYTSGSTGRPKGVRVHHRPLVHYALEMARQLGLRSTDRVLQFASLSFDVVVEELFPTWVSGGAVVFHEEDLLGAAAGLGSVLERQGVTALELPAAFWHEWVRGLAETRTALPPSLRLLLVGSEKPMPERLATWRELGVPLAYVFGLTETTVTSTLHWLPADNDGSGRDLDLPIGRPVANTAVYLLDAALQPVPACVAGEMYVGGAGVAQGYFGRPDLTAERFVPDPFGGEPGQRLYRTGDLARHRLDGPIEFLGRIDEQVKIRGFRVEPGEVEAELVLHPGVREAAVVARPVPAGGRRLVAYVVPEDGQALPVEELRAFLRRSLPDHMVPAAFVKLAGLPLTPNGKVDRRALPEPEGERPDLERDFVAPRTDAERRLAAIWSQALGVREVGIHDDFFALGGDSILSIQIVAKAQRQGLRLTPRQLFEHPTIAELADLAGRAGTAPAARADQGPVVGPVPLTPIQHWFFEQDFAEPHHFNLPLLLELRGVDPVLVDRTLPRLLEHHDALRLRFRRTASGWEQWAEPPGEAPAPVWIDLAALPEAARGPALEAAGAQLQESLDLGAGPLVRAARFGFGPGRRDHLLLAAHHLVMDTVSLQILVEDLAAACVQAAGGRPVELPPRTTSYKAWAERLADRAAGPEVAREAGYWAAPERAGVAPLPLDDPAGDATERSARTVARSLEADETRALLQEVPKAYRTQILDALLAALATALAPWTGDRRLLVELEGHGREEIAEDVDLSRTVGWFATLYPVLLDLREARGPGGALKAVKEQLRAVPHRGLHYGLLRYLAEPALAARLRALPRAEVLFNYVGQLDQAAEEGLPFALAGAPIGPSQSPRAARTHRLEVNAAVSGGRLTVSWTYSEGAHRRRTVERLAEGYLAALRDLVEHCRSTDAGGFTPSDFPLALLSQHRLDALVAACGGRVEDVYPLSPMQEGMLFHALFEPEAGMYVGQMSYRLDGELDAVAFERAWERVVARHPALRACFAWKDLDRPLQAVLPRVGLPWERQDWSGLEPGEQQRRLAAFAEADKRRGFDPGAAPLMRFALFRLGAEAHQFVWTHHQMLLDGWSLPLVLGDVFVAYEAARRGEEPRLGPAPSYRDYVAWLERQDRTAAEAFWRRMLGDVMAPTALAVEREHGAPGGHRERQVLLPARATAALQALARRHQLTLNTLVQGAWALVLHRYGGAPAVVFGAVVAGRPAELEGVEGIVGLFINTLPVRVDVAPKDRLVSWLKGLQERQLEMSRYEFSALSQVQRWSGVPAGQPLFETILAFQNQPSDGSVAEQASGLRASRGQTAERTNYPMTVVAEPGPRLSLILEYDRERFDDAAVLRLFGHLEGLLEGMTDAPHRLLADLPLLRAAERQQVLVEWQGPPREAEPAGTVHGAFFAMARQSPDSPAALLGEESLSYADLQARANRLARHLRALGVGPEVVVGLLVDRSLALVEGLLGVLAAGGAYLPLDPAYPAERLLYMLVDSGARVVVTTEPLAAVLTGWDGAVVRLDGTEAETIARRSAATLGVEDLPESLAYVIYTSGSTGRPKGVGVAHGAVVRYGREMVLQLGLKPEDRMLQFASPSFDVLVEELVPTWLAGAAVVLHGRDLLLSVGELEEVLERQGVTCLELPAAYWQEWVYELEQSGRKPPSSLRFLIVGSEKPSPERLRAWMDLGVPLVYIFGLTETTVTSSLHRLEPGELERADGFDLPIGRPVGETHLYVLDREGGPLPIGVAGELHVGGFGVGRGYVGRPELTAERFVPDGWGGEPGARLYRTGDLARWRAAGELDFLGRIDEQVKVRGFRVELGEIESALREHPQVRDAAVALRTRRLVGYVVAAGGEIPEAESLRSHLLSRLPEHMVPAAWVALEALPLTANGKLDRKALPEPEAAGERMGSVAPRTELEERLARIWSEVLGVERVGVEDDFFALGGDSILSLQIVARAHRAGIQLTPKQLFEHPTIGALAAVAGSGSTLLQAEQGWVTGLVPLTPIQRWFFHQGLAAPHHFNQSALLELRRPLALPLLEKVARRILEHHDALRLRYTAGPGGWLQVCEPPDGAVPLAAVDLGALPRDGWRGAIESAAEDLQGSLDLSAGPLLRLVLFDLGPGEPGRLLAVFHHLIVDEVSWRVLLEDLEQGYAQAAAGRPVVFPPKTTSFRTWAERLERHALSGALAPEASYWLAPERRLVRPLPVDFPRAESYVARTRTVAAALEAEETSRLLRDVPPVYRTQIQEVLLAALGLALARWTGERLALVDLEGHGREEIFDDVDLTRTVGWFATLYPMLLDLRTGLAPGDAIKAVKQQSRSLPGRGLGYGLLRHLAAGEVARELGALPPAELLFNYVGQLDQGTPEASGFGPARESSGLTVSPLTRRSHLLEITAMVVGGRLQVEWTYDPEIHRPETVESLAGWLSESLRSLIAHCLSPEAGGATPSDFPLAHLSQADLDRVVGRDREVEDVYVLSPVQEGMLFHTLYEPDAGMYVGQFSYELRGELDPAALRQAWQRAVDRHGALRTGVAWQGLDRPVQVVRRRVELPWEELDWRDSEQTGWHRRLEDFLAADRERGFDMARPPLLRVTLVRREEQVWQLVWSFHQMLLDGWSLPLVFEDVTRVLASRGAAELPPARPYRDYIAWLERQDLAEAERFWRRTLAGLREPTPLGAERAFGGEGLEESHFELETALSEARTQALQALARSRQLTLNTLFQGAWGLLLSRYAGAPDVVFGVTVSGRPPDLDGVEEIVGMFLNTLPVRVRVRGHEPWTAWLRSLQEEQLELRQYEHSPLAQIQKWSEIPAGRPLFESFLVFQNYPVEEAAAGEPSGETSVGDVAVAERGNYPLIFVVEPLRRLEMRIESDRRRFEPGAVHRMLGHLEAVLDGLLATPEGRVEDLSLLRAPERQQVLVEWQGPPREAEPAGTVHGAFSAMARQFPDAPAALLGAESLSYAELQARANRLARHLRSLGVGPEVVVGLLVDRSLALVEGLLGVLAAGGAYLPLDPAYPADRLLYMLADSGARVVLTTEPLAAVLTGWDGAVVRLDGAEAETIARRSATPLAVEALPESLAYVIYTSGSTGRPKGVGVAHEAVVRYGREMVRQLGLRPEDRMLQFASPSFDVLVEELVPTWLAGAAVVLHGRDLLLSVGDLEEVLERQGVTCLELPAAYWQEWVYELEQSGRRPPSSLRFLIVGSEKPSPERLRAWMGLGVPLVYIFGLTETTVTSSLHRLEPGELERADGFDLPIGRPVGETRLYVLDREGGPLPIGVAGELHVGGFGVGRGYVGRPELTAERFVPDGWGGEPGARLYRTGDLARWRAEGELDFLGRIDEQVKVRGFRVELGEIESALREHPQVRDAAVALRARRLVGYVVAADGEVPEAESLRSHLLARLPEHMVPAAWVTLEALPLTANGKLDRKALPEPEMAGNRADFVAPRTELEERLARIWSEVLGVERVGVEDDFFALGGDSILSLQIVARAHRMGIQLTPKQLFEHPTVGTLAAVAGSGSTLLQAEQGWVTGPVPLTPIQRWFFAQGFAAPHHFNQPLLLETRRPLDANLAERVLRRVMEHHDALRLRFAADAGGWSQVMEAPPRRAPVLSLDLSALPAERQTTALEEAAAAVQASLDLGGPLVRLALFDLGSERSGRLLLVFHHLVIDEVSMQVVLEDLETALGQALRGEPVRLPAKTSSYKAWAERLAEHARSGALAPELPFWLAPERELVEPLPVDLPGGANLESSARHAWSELTADETAALLREVPKAYRTPVQEVLLAALALTVARWTDRRLVLVDLEGQGREPLFADLDVSRTVGWFTAIHPVLLDLREALDPGAALKAVKEQVRSVPGGGVGYGLLRSLGGEAGERLGRLPAAELLFNYQGQAEGGAGEAGASAFTPAPEWPGPDVAPGEKRTHLLEVDGAVEGGRLRFAWTYSAGLHREETARALAGWFEESLRTLIAHCLSPEAGGYTPSDFPLAHLSQADLDRVVSRDREVEDVYALSPVQEGMLFHTLYEPDAGMYVGQFSYELRGELDRAVLREAWQWVVDRHGALRTGVAWQGLDRPVQVVRRRVELPWEELDWRGLDQTGRLADFLRADRERGFDMARPPLLRVTLVRREEQVWQLVWSFHQMLLDGWSLPLVFEDVARFFGRRQQAVEPELPPARPYREYIAWLERQDLAEAERFWRRTLAGLREPTPLGAERAFGGDGLEETFGELETVLSAARTQALQVLARSRQLTLNTLFQGAWGLLLSRYAGAPDVLFGVTVSGRPPDLDGVEEMVGMFLNTLPVRVRVRGREPWTAWLRGLQEEQLELRQYEHSPLAQIQKWSDVPAGRPLFESFLVFQNYPVEEAAATQATGGLSVGDATVAERGNYPLVFVVEPVERLEMRIESDRRRFEPSAVHRMLGHLEAVLEGLLAKPEGRVEDLPLLRAPERQQVLMEWQGPPREAEPAGTMHGAFSAVARQSPDAPAAILGTESLSYAELQARANRLARHLRSLGVGPEVVVGLLVDRSLALVEGLLGVLAAGGAYLPLDPAYPAERLLYMLADSGARVVVTTEPLAAVLTGWDGAVVRLDGAEAETIARRSAAPLAVEDLPESLAYVIYTSGSTGRPKGVGVAHEAVVRYGREMVRQLGLTAADRMLQFASPSFDVLVEELVPTWMSGAAVVLHGRDLLLSVGDLEEVLERQAVTCLELPAAYWQEWVYELEQSGRRPPSSLRFLIVGSEKPSPERLRAWMGLGVPLIYIFGLTETTVTSSLHRLEPGELERADGFDLPIGRPVGETRLYVLDREGGPLPIGVAGELHVGGFGVGRGYVGRPELTAERFVPDGWGGEPGARLYRTGDLARWRAAGELDFLGRIDEQVKVRGFRVELGEIESALREHPQVRDAAVALRARRLVGYVVPPSGAEAPEAESLRSHLLARLPEHMVPAAWVMLESLPLTANGKLDRRALPEPEKAGERTDFVAPRTDLEERLARIWSEVLGVERVGVEDDFFALGGDSILSLQIVARAHRAGIQLTPKQLFEHPTIGALAAVAGSGSGLLHAEQGWVTGPVPLTPIQRWFFAQGFAVPYHFNEPLLLEVRRPLDTALAERVLRRVMEHHDALRLRFVAGSAGWSQVMEAPPRRAPVLSLDLSALPAERQSAAVEAAAAAVQASLDLGGPLVRLALFDLGPERPGRLLLVLHHLVIDEVSMQVVLEDLETALGQALRGEPVRLPAKTSSYKAWAERLADHARSEALAPELPFWLAPERELVEPLPVDLPGGANLESSARHAWSELTADETAALLREVPKAYRTPVQEVLLTALVLAVARWTERRLVLVDLEGQGREPLFADLDVSRTVGWFTAIHPVLLDLREALDPGAALKAVKEQVRAVPGGGIGYGLLRYLGGEAGERLGRLPAAELLFNYQGQTEGKAAEAGASAFAPAPESPGPDVAPGEKRTHLLEVDGAVEDGRLRFSWTYSADLHREETARALAGWFEESLRSLIAHCLSPEAGGYTPSDFPLAHLSQADLDRVVGRDREIEDLYALSPVQEGMLFHTLYEPDAGMYVGQFSYELRGELDRAALRAAWQRVVDRHGALRTGVAWQGLDRPVQVVRRRVELPWEERDWRELEEAAQHQHLTDFLRADRERGFEVAKPPLLRVAVLSLQEERHLFLWSFHQMAMDGWSLPLLINEATAFYQALSAGRDLDLPRPRPFRDYIMWLQKQDASRAEPYWREALRGFGAPTPLPFDRPAGADGEGGHGEVEARLPARVRESLDALARQSRLTLNTLVQGAWALLLSSYSGEEDVVFGATVSGRPPELEGIEEMVGLFINSLPVRVVVSPEEPLVDWLRRLQERQVELREFEYSPLFQVQRWSDVPAGQPLFDSILVFENYPQLDGEAAAEADVPEGAPGLQIGDSRVAEQANYPLALGVEMDRELLLRINYDESRFDQPTIVRLLGHMESLLLRLPDLRTHPLHELQFLTDGERHQLLVEWSDAAAELGWRPVHELFHSQAARTPAAPAVELAEGESWTYDELNRRANRLAHHLRALGVRPGDLVGLCLERSAELVAAILGIFKAGAVYVPLDPAYPRERLAFMLADSEAAVLLTTEALLAELPAHGALAVALDTHCEVIARAREDDPAPLAGLSDVAYLIYTSGTTGRPKAVMVEHGNLANTLLTSQRRFGFQAGDVMLHLAPFSFDISLFELLNPLLAGGASLLVPRERILDLPALARDLERATLVHTVPSLMRQILGHLRDRGAGASGAGLRRIFIGGDSVAPELLDEMRQAFPAAQVHVLYGPTEATIICASHAVPREGRAERSLIGRPLDNVALRVLDRAARPVPVGVAGELYVGGAGVTRGYLRRDDLTQEKFPRLDGQRFYRTGDLARFRPDGNLEFLGRIDQQVKVRGFRVELGEIESVLAGHPGVREAVVVARDEGGEKRLAAYVVPAQEPALTATELRRVCQEQLPDYMVPSFFVTLESLPLTPAGKVDRRALPAPEGQRPDLEADYVSPETALQNALAGIWAEVLGSERIGLHDDFFELGGDSILSLQICARAHRAGIQITPKQIFQNPTVERLAAVAGTAGLVQAEQGPVTGPVPLTPVQARFLERDPIDPHHFNLPVLLEVRRRLAPELAERVLQEVLAHHDALRMRFVREETGWWQTGLPPGGPAPMACIDLSALPDGRFGSAIEEASGQVQTSLDLARGPLARLALFDLGAGHPGRLLLVFHHLVADEISLQILLEDLEEGFEQASRGAAVKLPPKTSSFKTWAERLAEHARSEPLAAEAAWWLEPERELVVPLPTDLQGVDTDAAAESAWAVLPAEETRALLHEVPKVRRTQVQEMLLAAVALALARWSGERLVLVDVEGHGREELFLDVNVARTVGWFTTVYPVLLDLRGADAPREVLNAAREQLRAVPGHGIGYGLLRYLGDAEIAGRLRRMPQAEVVFNYRGQGDDGPAAPEADPSPAVFVQAAEPAGPDVSPRALRDHRLEIEASIEAGELRVGWTYGRNIYRPATAAALADGFLAAIRELIAACLAPEAESYAPSDFPLAQLNDKKLDQLAGLLDEIDRFSE